MNYNSFKYSGKVWLTSVFTAPVLFCVIQSVRNGFNDELLNSLFSDYLLFIGFEFVFSFPTWLVFWATISLIKTFVTKPSLNRRLILVSGMLLTFGTFAAVMYDFKLWKQDRDILILVLSNCLCIGLGCWLYRSEPKDPLTAVETASPEY